MTWMDHFSALLARKSSRAGAAVAAVGLAPARWTPRRYDRLAEEGYRKNVVAYRCVREVARACASVPWLLYRGQHEVDTHPLLDLLHRPNPRQSGPELIEAVIGHLLLSGNAYLEVVHLDDAPPRELYALRPDRMRVIPHVSGVPRAYRYEVDGRSVDWPVAPITGASDVLHLRDFHPLDDWYGLSPIEAAAQAIDQHNAAAEHNAALLQNGARPSGALIFRSDPGPDGIRRVEDALLDRTQGPRQAGKPLVLGGDVDWKELGFSPRDMDFAETKAQAAREISSAFGVPHPLVVAGEATFNNRADARLELWEHTVIPLLDRLSSALTTWLGPMLGEDLRLALDLDEVPALAPRRRLKWQQIAQADFLTLNEKRQALGYEPIDEGDGGERKNSADYERIHGRPQPRISIGEPGAGRWVDDNMSGRPSTFLVSLEDNDPQLNPHPEDPDCVDEWKRALAVCFNQLGKRKEARSRGLFGPGFMQCLLGQVSERCGGRKVGRTRKDYIPACEYGCVDAASRTTIGDMTNDLQEIERLVLADKSEDALALCDERLRSMADCRETRVHRAVALRSLERYEEAIAEWGRVVLTDPDDAAPYFSRGELFLSCKRYREAIGEFNRAESLDDGYFASAIKIFRARCYLRLADFDKAAADIAMIPQDEGHDRLRRSLEDEARRKRTN